MEKTEWADCNRIISLILFVLTIAALVAAIFESTPEKTKLYADIARVFAMLAAAFWIVYTWKHERQKEKHILTYEQLKEFYEQYLGTEVIDHRKTAYAVWAKHVILPDKFCQTRFPTCGESVADITKTITKVLKVKIEIPTQEQVEAIEHEKIRSTEFICNKFEQLGKLVECGVIEEKVLQTFFYTMLADTFLIVLPYICYRRQTKPKWAHKFQALVHEYPDLSADLSRV